MAGIHDNAAQQLAAHVKAAHSLSIRVTDVPVDLLASLLDERAELKQQLADVAPYAEAGKQAALELAKRDYYTGTCDSCMCCTTAQCSEGRCPTNSIGDSICPCTCD